ncbi:hypothetical protein FHW19_004200 [Ochrobactrum anthropi]|uniref:hypothetical protein n=1 Tax=Brucella anthropi TaxID=529 RepID=UPI0015FA7D78|nr:hypothetical protein [Brucella anthropi]MBA8862454.1 hypothetical protein [Brucella anthropi]
MMRMSSNTALFIIQMRRTALANYRDVFLKIAVRDVFRASDLTEYRYEFAFLNTKTNALQIENLAYYIDRRIQC